MINQRLEIVSRKQEIYKDMTSRAVILIRNLQTSSILMKAISKTSYYEAELVHNLSISMLNADFEEHDVWFLNNQAAWYLRNCSESNSINYNAHKKDIYELFDLVPIELKSGLNLKI